MSSPSSFEKAQRTEQALRFLRQVKPKDGWSADRYISPTSDRKARVTLRRRNIALVDDCGFEELFHDETKSGSIFGVLSYIESTESLISSSTKNNPPTNEIRHARVMELVDVKGNLIRNPEKSIVILPIPPVNYKSSTTVKSLTDKNIKSNLSLSSNTSLSSSSSPLGNSTNTESKLRSEEESKQILQYGLLGFICLVLLKLILSSSILYFLILPIAILYALQTCPGIETFDVKKELKRVLRGTYLPQEQQPQDWFTKTINRVQASISTELATGLGGYQVQFIQFIGVCAIAFLQVPLVGKEYIWIGIFGKWIYLYQRNLPNHVTTSTSDLSSSLPNIFKPSE